MPRAFGGSLISMRRRLTKPLKTGILFVLSMRRVMSEPKDSWKPPPYSERDEEPSIGKTVELDALELQALLRKSTPPPKEGQTNKG